MRAEYFTSGAHFPRGVDGLLRANDDAFTASVLPQQFSAICNTPAVIHPSSSAICFSFQFAKEGSLKTTKVNVLGCLW